MTSRTRFGLGLLGAALFLGVLGDALLRKTPLGLNLFLWVVALVLVMALVARALGARITAASRWMIPVLLLFAALVMWRDSPWLLALNLLAIVLALTLGALRVPSSRLHRAGVSDYVLGLGSVGAAAGARTVSLVQEIEWQELPRGPQARQAVAVGRGLALALPFLVVFGALFIAADTVFQSFVSDAVPDGRQVVVHGLLIAVFAWVSGGMLREFLRERESGVAEVRPTFTLGATELVVILGLVDLLFLAFVLVQVRYLFGGSSLVEERTGLTYAEYARHGFFELVTVAALVLPLLLLADWILRRERARHETWFRVLAGALVLLVFVVMASALERMRLYQREYGLTELRFYATAFMLGLAVMFAWLAFTVLRGRRDLFAVGAVVTAFAAVLALNAINPDAVIARTNLDRPHVDLVYLTELSDDATPALVEALPGLPAGDRRDLALALRERELRDTDWRTWNWSRSRARDALARLPADP
jgi:Domain of unknown function (DUF4173)